MIFIDSNYIVGLFVKNDNWHEKANAIIDYIDKKEKVTCNLVISETITLINKKIGVDASKYVYDYILHNFIIIDEDRELYNKAIETLIKYHNLSFTDSLIIEIMKELNITEIATFDKHLMRKKKL
ncbi:MAG: type II toxin-antitoxin system VapC family toxin [Methanobacteriaceae archaeon]